MCGVGNMWLCVCVGFVMCGCVYVWVVKCLCECVGLVICGCVYVWGLYCVGVCMCGGCIEWVVYV